MKGTIKELSAHYGIPMVNMYGLIKSLLPKGHAKVVGNGPKPKRGRTSAIYQLSKEIQAILDGKV